MSPTKLSYDELKQEFSQQIQKAEHGVLATSQGDYVTAREMAILTDGEKIYCCTASHTRKYKQILANNNVALSINNLQIEGIATLKGNPLDEENAEFIKMFDKEFPKAYEFWRKHLEEPGSSYEVIEITPRKLTAYKRSPDIGTLLDILNVVTKKATRAYLNDMDYDQFKFAI